MPYGYSAPPAVIRFAIGRRFGHSFGAEGGDVIKETTGRGTWTIAGTTKLTFKLCPRGGRDVSGC